MKSLQASLILMLLLVSCSNQKEKNQFYFPADFDPVKSTWFIWSEEYYGIIPKLIGIISAKDKVTVYLNEKEADVTAVQKVLEKYGSTNNNISLVKIQNMPKSNWIGTLGLFI